MDTEQGITDESAEATAPQPVSPSKSSDLLSAIDIELEVLHKRLYAVPRDYENMYDYGTDNGRYCALAWVKNELTR